MATDFNLAFAGGVRWDALTENLARCWLCELKAHSLVSCPHKVTPPKRLLIQVGRDKRSIFSFDPCSSPYVRKCLLYNLNRVKSYTQILATWVLCQLPQFVSITLCIWTYEVRLNFYYVFLHLLYMHIVIMYNNIYYNLTYIATASAPYIYGLEIIRNDHQYTKQDWRWPTRFGKTRLCFSNALR